MVCLAARSMSQYLVEDTWIRGAQSAAYAAYGAGCAGSNGVLIAAVFRRACPDRRHVPNRPERSAARVGDVAAPWGIRRGVGAIQLPLDLRPFGMPGCTLLASGELAVPVLNLGGTGSFTWLLPDDGARRRTLLQPGVHARSRHQPAGVIASNAGSVRSAPGDGPGVDERARADTACCSRAPGDGMIGT